MIFLIILFKSFLNILHDFCSKVGREGEIQPLQIRPLPINQFSIVHERELGPHDPYALVKCCESLAFLVRDLAHITPYNFENCVHCIRTCVEASLHTGICIFLLS